MLLAQINIGRTVATLDDPLMADFVAALPIVNAAAEQADGFCWRFEADYGDPITATLFGDPLILVNLSVWKSVDEFKRFVFGTEHLPFMRDRRRWFQQPPDPHLALWWIEESHWPTLAEAKLRLDHLRDHGDSEFAFSLKWLQRNSRYSPE